MGNKENIVRSTLISAGVAIAIIVVLTIGGELNPPLKNWLASTFIHNWIGKGVVSSAAFLLSILVFSFFKLRFLSLTVLLWFLVLIANASAAVLVLFFLAETFLLH